MLPVILDSTTTSFDIIDSSENRSLLFFSVDFLRANLTNLFFYQNYLDIQFGLGYNRLSSTSNPELPQSGAWPTQLPSGNTRGGYRFRPTINTFNFNSSISMQPTNFLMGYIYHAIGYSTVRLYESTGGDYYLSGKGTSEIFALGIQAIYHPKNQPFSFFYGIEANFQRIKFLTVEDPSQISHISGLDLFAKGIAISFGTILGGKRTSGDHAFTNLINRQYEEAVLGFEQFIIDYPEHSRKPKAQEMLIFSSTQIPYQQFRRGLDLIDVMHIDSAAIWLDKASKAADEDLLFEINSRKKNLAMKLIDSVAVHKSKMKFKEAERIIQKARKIAPQYPLGDAALAEIYIEKGDMLLNRKSFRMAYEYYKQANDLSTQYKKLILKKYNDLTRVLMDEANLFAENGEFILSIDALNNIIQINPERSEDLNPIIERLSLELNGLELLETNKKVAEIMQVKQKKLEDKNSFVLLLGMTISECKDITGEPEYIDKIERGGILYEMWTLVKYKNAKRIYFENNLLVKIEK